MVPDFNEKEKTVLVDNKADFFMSRNEMIEGGNIVLGPPHLFVCVSVCKTVPATFDFYNGQRHIIFHKVTIN